MTESFALNKPVPSPGQSARSAAAWKFGSPRTLAGSAISVGTLWTDRRTTLAWSALGLISRSSGQRIAFAKAASGVSDCVFFVRDWLWIFLRSNKKADAVV